MVSYSKCSFVTILQKNFLDHKQSVAVEDGDNQYTYEELGQAVLALSDKIASLQKDRRQGVAVLGKPSYSTVVSVLGTVLSGRVYVPIDPAWPSLRIQQILKDAGIRLIVGQTLPPNSDEALRNWNIDHFIAVGQNIKPSKAYPFDIILFDLAKSYDAPQTLQKIPQRDSILYNDLHIR